LGAGTYYFALTASNSAGQESGYSNEVSKTVAAAGCTYTVAPTNRSLLSTAQPASFTVTTGSTCAWTAGTNASWMTRTSASSITESGTGCVYSISPTSKNFAGAGGQGSVALTGPSGCGWTASSTETWITISSSNSGSGNATVGYSVQSNTASSSRTGMLIIGGRILTVNQAANNQTFFPQFSAGAEWESELVLTNPSSSETATGSVTVLNDGGEQIEDSGSRSFTIEPLGS